MAFDTIPAKLVKLSVDFLTPLLTKPLNTNIAQNVFPENVKTASVKILDKSKPNKNCFIIINLFRVDM